MEVLVLIFVLATVMLVSAGDNDNHISNTEGNIRFVNPFFGTYRPDRMDGTVEYTYTEG